MVRSLLKRSGILKSFWPEAVNWSIHILNRSPTFSVQNMTPEEAWSGQKPVVDHFRIFGCIAYAHVPDQRRTKLEDKGVKCIFLGVSNQSKAYKLYNPNTKKIIISRDVFFNEQNFWSESKSVAEQNQMLADFDDIMEKEQQQPTEHQVDDSEQQQPADQHVGDSSSHVPGSPTATTTEERPHRVRRRPGWMVDFELDGINQSEDTLTNFVLFSDCDPTVFEEAAKESKWKKAMNEEIAAIERNNTWELVDLPQGHKTIGVKWVYKTKLKEDGEVDKYKARLVTKGYKQEFGVDYTEVFAPVARHDTIRLVLALAAQNSWPIFQLDVKSAFLHGDLQEQVFIDQPPGYIKPGCEDKVYKLKKALYGLKQAPRAWYSRIETYFLKGFRNAHLSIHFL